MPVRNRIKNFIEANKITVYQFGKNSGISQTTAYALYHNPEQRPSPSVLDKICDCYEIQPGEILEWVPPEKVKDE